jgi:protein SCO1/2
MPLMIRALLLLSLALFGSAAAAADDALIAGVFNPPRLAPDFTLRGSDGAELKMSRYRGKVVLLAFGYSSCEAVCPITLGVLAQARKKLDVAAGQLQVIYITVDPDRDDAARMRTFLGAFDPSFIGGTGTPSQLAAVRTDYGISVSAKMPVPGGGYALNHSSFIYLIGRSGKLRALMPYGHGPDDFVHDVRILLKQE